MRVRTHLANLYLLTLITVSSCATQPSGQSLSPIASKIQPPELSQKDVVGNDAPSQPILKHDYPVRPFPTQTFYELLVAEFAGVRGDLNFALEKYLAQAIITRDPNVTERAARTATFLKNREALKKLSSLWVDIDANSSEARKLAFIFAARNRNFDQAFDHALFLLRQGDSEPLVSLPGFLDEHDSDNHQQLLDKYTQLNSTQPRDRNILLGKIQLEGLLGKIEQAEATGNELLILEPKNENARLAVAQLLYHHNKQREAMAILAEGIAENPQSKKLQLQQVRFIAEQDLPGAQKKMAGLAVSFPDDFNLQYSLALINVQLGLRDEARRILGSMIDHNRRTSDAHYQLAVMADQEGSNSDAIFHYGKASTNDELLLPVTARLTQLMVENGEMTEARLYLHRLRIEHPTKVIALYRLESELLMRSERYESAYSLLSEGLVAHPENFDLLYTRSLVSEKLNDIANVEKDLRAILDRDAGNASALNALGYSLINYTDRYDEALQLIRKALQIQPEDPAIIDSLGWALFRMGNNGEALVRLRQALAAMPDPEVAAHLGEVLWVTGETEEALNIWRGALERDPESKYLLETLHRLKVEY